MLLILEHSFYLFHQNDPQPVLSAVQKYKTSTLPMKVKSAMKEICNRYGKATKEEKIAKIVKAILQNKIGM